MPNHPTTDLVEVPELSFNDFHTQWLPGRLTTPAADAAARDVDGIEPLSLRVQTGPTFTYQARDGRLQVVEGAANGAVVVEFDESSFRAFLTEELSAAGVFYSGQIKVIAGEGHRFLRWEPALRALYHGRPILDLDAIELRDRAGDILDITNGFDFEAAIDSADAAHFMKTAGFLLVHNVFAMDEVAALRAECDRARALMTPGDRRAWWGNHADGTSICTRVNYAGEISELVGNLYDDPRLEKLIEATGDEVRPAHDRLDGATVIFKTPDMREGLSDLPWHRDCGMGGHPVMCPLINLSVHLTAVSAESGDLRAVPGSFAGTTHPVDSHPGESLGVSMAAKAGDVTLHYGDLVHSAPAPTTGGKRTGRVTINLTYPNVRCFEVVGPGQGYNDALLNAADSPIST